MLLSNRTGGGGAFLFEFVKLDPTIQHTFSFFFSWGGGLGDDFCLC